MRLRTVSCQGPGWRRVRHGRGFRYVDAEGAPVGPDDVERIKALAIPPAWTDVWVCPDDRGHLQAVGTDDAGRRQYLYHPEWRRKRDEQKFDRVIDLGRRLPRLRTALHRELAGDPADRATVVAAAVRLVDLGCFRLGSETAADANGSFGLTTLQVRHVRRDGQSRVFRFVGKSGVDHEIVIADRRLVAVVDALTERRRQDGRLLATRDGRRWVPVVAAEVNERIRELSRLDVTAKDFRTWKATATVAKHLADVERAPSASGRGRQVRAAIAEAADLLGNTVSVARSSYVDPRVVDLFEDGHTIGRVRSENGVDRAVVDLLTR
ncbi:MAG TPA: DNA topoisomerase IB [Aeromicrobium sp.]|nr:DNA topoisomerase IB [Aeromicrobium sp.]HKY58113.1 DNA topoisomerase IB [Aeromicrobium sp.]